MRPSKAISPNYQGQTKCGQIKTVININLHPAALPYRGKNPTETKQVNDLVTLSQTENLYEPHFTNSYSLYLLGLAAQQKVINLTYLAPIDQKLSEEIFLKEYLEINLPEFWFLTEKSQELLEGAINTDHGDYFDFDYLLRQLQSEAGTINQEIYQICDEENIPSFVMDIPMKLEQLEELTQLIQLTEREIYLA